MSESKTLAVVRRQFAQTVFNHKIQEVAAERKEKYASSIVLVQLMITTFVIGVLAMQALGKHNTLLNIVATALTVAELIELIVERTYGYSKQARDHKIYALKYLSLRDKYIVLIGDIMEEALPARQVISERSHLLDIYEMLNDAPQTNSSDYGVTQYRLGTAGPSGKEHETWSDKEIDSFLPVSLRVGVKKAPSKA